MEESPQHELLRQSRKAVSEFRLRWLLAFPDMPVRDEVDAQLMGEIETFVSAREIFGTQQRGAPQGIKRPGPHAVPYIGDQPMTVKMLREFQQDVRITLKRLASGEAFDLPLIGATFQVRNSGPARVPPAEGGVLQKEYRGNQRQVFLAAVCDVLQDNWHLIRWCANPDCQKPFVPIRRQEYHDKKCSQKVRTARYLSKE